MISIKLKSNNNQIKSKGKDLLVITNKSIKNNISKLKEEINKVCFHQIKQQQVLWWVQSMLMNFKDLIMSKGHSQKFKGLDLREREFLV